MRGKTGRASIIGQLGRTARSMAVVLMLPVLLSLVMLFWTATRYQTAVTRMATAAELKPAVGTQLPEQLFSVAAGRTRYEESGIDALLESVNRTLDRLLAQTTGEGTLELTVARRTMDTLAGYVERARAGMAAGMPIIEVEMIVDEVRDVGDLVTDMLDDFISVEIDNTAKTSAGIRRLVWSTALAEALLLMLAMIRTGASSRHLADDIRRAILKLEDSVHRLTGGDLKARVPDMDVEELKELARQINVMANRLEDLIERSRLEQENLAKSELRHLNGYLSIQKTRYRDILNYEVEADPAMNGYMILKLLLQPLVENALYHGIKYKRGGGTIRVRGFLKDDLLCFEVQDTGSGMTPERLEEVREAMRLGRQMRRDPNEPEPGGGFGLYNVDQRIRLYYNLDHGLSIESGPGGTTVSFRVPALTSGRDR